MKIHYILSFIVFYLKEIILSTISVAADILNPRLRINPAIVDVPVKDTRPVALFILSNLVSMTPGSLALSYNPENQLLTVHLMHGENQADFEKLSRTIQDKVSKIITKR